MASSIIVFDVNETLLDLAPLDPVFESLFGDRGVRSAWFSSLLHWSKVTTMSGVFHDFTALAAACLDDLAARHGLLLSDDQRRRIFATIATLPPHPEVPAALARLQDRGFRLIALTNSAQATVDRQFEHAGLAKYFAHVLSVDAARCYKPHPSAYGIAVSALDCRPADLRLVAAHDWDVTGAMRAGLKGAFVARHGERPHPAGETPDIIGRDLDDVAAQIIAADV